MADPTVGVLRRETHGMPLSEYEAALRDRLPDLGIRVPPRSEGSPETGSQRP